MKTFLNRKTVAEAYNLDYANKLLIVKDQNL